MKELIKININEEGKQLVSARELYLGLGLNQGEWSRWYKRNIEQNEYFNKNVDWVGFVITPNRGGKEVQDFAISLDFAKHIAMMARTEKSHEYRNYFIECEKKVNQLPQLSKELQAIFALDGKQQKLELEWIINLIGGVVPKSSDLFIESKYQHIQNKQFYKEYLLTRDGFSLLVMRLLIVRFQDVCRNNYLSI